MLYFKVGENLASFRRSAEFLIPEIAEISITLRICKSHRKDLDSR